jgi:hypothetical protein
VGEFRVAKFFDNLYDRLENTDYITEFQNRADIVDRLLPFAFNFEPDYSEEYLDEGERFLDQLKSGKFNKIFVYFLN